MGHGLVPVGLNHHNDTLARPLHDLLAAGPHGVDLVWEECGWERRKVWQHVLPPVIVWPKPSLKCEGFTHVMVISTRNAHVAAAKMAKPVTRHIFSPY